MYNRFSKSIFNVIIQFGFYSVLLNYSFRYYFAIFHVEKSLCVNAMHQQSLVDNIDDKVKFILSLISGGTDSMVIQLQLELINSY